MPCVSSVSVQNLGVTALILVNLVYALYCGLQKAIPSKHIVVQTTNLRNIIRRGNPSNYLYI
jgi:hypothetical protein